MASLFRGKNRCRAAEVHDFSGGSKVANHKSAVKRMRQSEDRRLRNRTIRSQVRTETKKLNSAIEDSEPAVVKTQLKETMKQLAKAGSKGVLKKKTASRRIGRLAKAVHKKLAPTT
jgi:small subunit ribosomal protein S20